MNLTTSPLEYPIKKNPKRVPGNSWANNDLPMLDNLGWVNYVYIFTIFLFWTFNNLNPIIYPKVEQSQSKGKNSLIFNKIIYAFASI